MNITNRNPATLTPYHQNNKRHPDHQIKKIMQSLQDFGFTQPIVTGKDGIVIIGHARLEAAQRLGLETVPTVEIDATEHDERRLRLLDNKLSDLGEYDNEAILAELQELDNPNLWEIFAELLGGTAINPDDIEDDFELNDADRAEYGNMTFIVTEYQKELITNAINIANGQLANRGEETPENGHAMAHIAREFLKNQITHL
jgi:hypothetical protein